ncbi:Apoptosis facilitator Bcl-2-like protein 14 [Channa argus]|uniref:Apoptosis facilitator Bcl-2-like protein 14 n=2 Tax=Channa argus TaxID=215402 RepID=A0A6G1QUK8_CHAAH|nr:Apoptosis facilitator Bcl-2-like protein 14 [Channa argus]
MERTQGLDFERGGQDAAAPNPRSQPPSEGPTSSDSQAAASGGIGPDRDLTKLCWFRTPEDQQPLLIHGLSVERYKVIYNSVLTPSVLADLSSSKSVDYIPKALELKQCLWTALSRPHLEETVMEDRRVEVKMAGASAMTGEQSEILLLLEQYCSKRSRQTSTCRNQWKKLMSGERFSSTVPTVCTEGPVLSNQKAPSIFSTYKVMTLVLPDRDGAGVQSDDSPSRSHSAVAERLVEINKSAPIPEVVVEDQDETIRKLVELMITFGDDINMKIHQDPVLQEQLSNLSYDTFQKLTFSVQNLVQSGPAAESEDQIQQQKISWAFEVTSRMSVITVVQRRRVLSYGDQYIQQHHSAWIQEHGGWDEVFDVD